MQQPTDLHFEKFQMAVSMQMVTRYTSWHVRPDHPL